MRRLIHRWEKKLATIYMIRIFCTENITKSAFVSCEFWLGFAQLLVDAGLYKPVIFRRGLAGSAFEFAVELRRKEEEIAW